MVNAFQNKSQIAPDIFLLHFRQDSRRWPALTVIQDVSYLKTRRSMDNILHTLVKIYKLMGCATSCYLKLSKILSFTAFIGMKNKPKTCITVHSSRARNLLACFDCLEIVDNYRGSDPRIELGSQEP